MWIAEDPTATWTKILDAEPNTDDMSQRKQNSQPMPLEIFEFPEVTARYIKFVCEEVYITGCGVNYFSSRL